MFSIENKCIYKVSFTPFYRLIECFFQIFGYSSPEERDEWLKAIQGAVDYDLRKRHTLKLEDVSPQQFICLSLEWN